jgi:ABC-type protease/lipase transport system fused ATPase/permease subunit
MLNKLAVIGDGQLQAFGPKDEVLARVIQPVGVTRGPQPLRQAGVSA